MGCKSRKGQVPLILVLASGERIDQNKPSSFLQDDRNPCLGESMFAVGTPLLVLAGLAGILVLFGVGTLLFQAGCALADVPVRGYFRSLPVYSAAAVICVPLIGVLLWFAGRYESDPNATFGSMRIAALIVALLLTWLLSSGIYALLLAASLRKGLLIAGIELLLMALLAALVSAVVLVILAFVQIVTSAPPVKATQNPPPVASPIASPVRS
jgi:hypothetical protein